MSDLNIRTLLSKTVTAIKEKLSIDSFTWGEYEDKLAETMSGGESVDLVTFFEDGSNADEVVKSLSRATTIREGAFAGCTSLTTVELPSATLIESSAFARCTSLNVVDLSSDVTFGEYVFADTGNFKCLVLRNTEKVCDMGLYTFIGSRATDGYPFYIYVPSALIIAYENMMEESLKSADIIFRELEDYTVDGTTTGALDWDVINAPS